MNLVTVLHAEDDSNDVLLFHHACLKAGLNLNLQVVADGDEAIAYLDGRERFGDRQQHPFPKLVLLDLKMPRVDGFEVLSWMRQEEKCRRLPVVVLSSSNHEVDVNRAYDGGANSYLVKPVDFNELVEMVKALHLYWLTFNEGPEPAGNAAIRRSKSEAGCNHG
ncbi:MAG TPA: response regulator [Candidatus Binatia bacterium]|jgi:CheY-like chemotaxis protein|nr:response regulator [Candidatus Binatia bacterium]